MHETALRSGQEFFHAYLPAFERPRIVDVGAYDENGSLRQVCPPGVDYVGVDICDGPGVDVKQSDPYVLPFADASADVVVSSSCLEHAELFWVLFLEMLRVLRPQGVLYINAPSNGAFHRHPVDCWRFYPDSGLALVTWARRCGLRPALLESYTSVQSPRDRDGWNDFVAVFLKDEGQIAQHPRRILHTRRDVFNGIVHGRPDFVNFSWATEDKLRLWSKAPVTPGT
ncbi:MAG: class I SAM-dependent methyltransferase [Burkholderiales bacterium]|nr:class I SAM-dependent methyltransferase [Burkholderiales bacterium]